MFKNMKIGVRLGTGFGVLILLILTLAFFSFRGMGQIDEKLENIVKDKFPKTVMANDLLDAANLAARAMRNMLILEKKEDIQKEAGRVEEARKRATEGIEKLQKVVASAKGKELFKGIVDSRAVYASRQAEVVKLAQEGKKKEAAELLITKVRDAQSAYFESVQKIVAHQNEGMEKEGKAAADVYQSTKLLMFILLGISVLLGLGVALWITRSITKPVAQGVDFAKKMADGDLTQNLEIDQKDEIGVLAKALNQMSSNLRQMFKNISTGVNTLASSSTELSAISSQTASGVKKMSDKATTVAAAAEEASANSTSVAASIEETSTNLTSVASATEQMSATVAEIASNSEKGRAISEQATVQAQTISGMMQQLGEAAKEIGKVTETITDISSQTNLLALNATIEAARAGAAGKGFAVVANEIKELARQTAAATEDIKTKIAGVQTSTGGAIADIEKITGVIKEVGSIVSTIAAAIEEQATVTKDVAGNIAQASTGVKDANERVAQTATVSKSIASDVAAVNSAVGEIRQGGEQVQVSAGELSKLAEQLKGMVEQFKV